MILNPARCEGKLADRMWDDERFVAEPKLDGSRYLLYYDSGRCRLISRGQKIDRAANVPHITKYVSALNGTVLDGEIIHPSRSFTDTISVVNSSPAEARRKQEVDAPLDFVVFDILMHKGEDLRRKPLWRRRAILEKVVEKLDNESIKLMPQVKTEKREFYENLVEEGGEGVILKDSRLRYGNGWCKVKARTDVSVIITKVEKTSAHGMRAEMAVYDEKGKLIPVGNVAVSGDRLQSKVGTNTKGYVGKVLDVFAFDIHSVSLRNPVWHRLRLDVDPKTCTLKKLVSDIKLNKK